jgi:hypothetical protein
VIANGKLLVGLSLTLAVGVEWRPGTGITKLCSFMLAVFITELADQLVDIDFRMGCLVERLGDSDDNAFVVSI